MIQKRMRHSKFKNTGILFELLTRQVTADILAGREISTAKNILYKYFRENTELGREWQYYNTLLNEKIKDEVHADRMLSIIINARKKLNDKKLLQEKYELIKDIKKSYPLDEMLKTPVRNYKLLASIYKVFEDATSSTSKFEVSELFQAKTCLVEHILDKPKKHQSEDDLINFYKTQSEDIRLLSYKLLVEKLNDKYSNALNDEQKDILREYIGSVANTNNFDSYVKDKVLETKNCLLNIIDKINDSNVMRIKLKEVTNQLDRISVEKVIKDSHVTVLMLSHELLKECQLQLNSQ